MNMTSPQCIAYIADKISHISKTWSQPEMGTYLNAGVLQAFVTQLATAEALRADDLAELESAKKAALVKIEELMRSAQEIAASAGVPFVVPTTVEAAEFEESDSWSNSSCY